MLLPIWGCRLFGYCQPVGGSPEHNIDPESTSDFCVGQFLLGAVQVRAPTGCGRVGTYMSVLRLHMCVTYHMSRIMYHVAYIM